MRGAAITAVLFALLAAPAAAADPDLPTGSVRADGPTGVNGWAILLERAGHRVEGSRTEPADRPPRPGELLIMVAGRPPGERDRSAVLAAVSAGADVLAAGAAARTLRIAGLRPVVAAPGAILPVDPRYAIIRDLRTRGGAFSSPPPAGCTPLMVMASGPPAVLRCTRGRGTITLVADDSMFWNSLLGKADNAAFAILLAGAPSRRVTFLETIHYRVPASGGSPPQGLSLLPVWAKRTLIVLALALLAWLLAQGRRLGPPEELARRLPPPRRAHVDALGARLARTRDRKAAARIIAGEARDQLGRRFGLGPDPAASDLVAVAVAAGIGTAEIAALRDPAAAGLLAAGDALAAVNTNRQAPGSPL